MIQRLIKSIDWSIVVAIVPLLLAGLATMTSFGSQSALFEKQLLWVIVGLVCMFAMANIVSDIVNSC